MEGMCEFAQGVADKVGVDRGIMEGMCDLIEEGEDVEEEGVEEGGR